MASLRGIATAARNRDGTKLSTGMHTKFAIIGGSGKMGKLLARLLLQEGRQVIITGRDPAKLAVVQKELGVSSATNVEAVKWAETVIVSVSIDSFEAVIKEIAPHVRSGQIVADITSVKEFPVAVMHQYIKTGMVLGTHPVFGPAVKDLKGQNIVLTPVGEDETALAKDAAKHLEAMGATVSIMTPRRHDELMTVVLGLAHFISLVSADTLASQDNLELIKAVSGGTFRSLVALVKSVVSEDPQLYSYIQMNLPGITDVERQFRERTKLWADIVTKKDRRAFIERMNELRDRLERAL